MRVARSGISLVELLIALLLSGVVLSSFARTASVQRRAEATLARNSRSAATADEVVRVVAAAAARVARADSVWLRGDTAVEWRAPIGAAVACVADADSLVVPDAGLGAWWESVPDSGDGAQFLTPAGEWRERQVVAVRTRSVGACAGGARVLRVHAPLEVAGAVAVRVTRRTRLVLYRGGDGDWWLGERQCPFTGAVRCGPAQPIAGPVRASPTGLEFAIDSGPVRALAVVARSGGAVRHASVTFPK